MLPVKTSCKDYWVLWLSCHYKYWIESLESLSCSPPSRGLIGTMPPTKQSNLKQKSLGLMDLSLGGGWFEPSTESTASGTLVLCLVGAAHVFCQLLVNKSTLQSWVWLIGCLPSLCVENTFTSSSKLLFSPSRIWVWFLPMRNCMG